MQKTVGLIVTMSPDEYGNPERIANELSKFGEIESIDITTGDWEIKVISKIFKQELKNNPRA